MAYPIQGQPGEPSQATADETPTITQDTIPSVPAESASEPATTNTQPPAPETAEVDWSKVGVEDYQRLKAETFGPSEYGEPTAQDPESTPEPSTQSAEPAPSLDPPPAEPEEAVPFGEKFRPRLGKLPKVKQETVQLVREMEEAGTPIDFADAEARVKAKYGLPAAPATEPAQQQDAPKTAAQIEQEIKDLRAERIKAAAGADLEAMAKLDDAIDEAKEQKAQAKEAESLAEHAQLTEADRALADAKTKVRTDFPDFQNDQSPLSLEFQRVYDELEAEESPILATTPEKQLAAVAKIAAANLGIRPAAKAAPRQTQQSSTSTLPANPPQARPVSPASGSARTARPPTDQHVTRIAAVKTTDDYEKMKAEYGL